MSGTKLHYQDCVHQVYEYTSPLTGATSFILDTWEPGPGIWVFTSEHPSFVAAMNRRTVEASRRRQEAKVGRQ